MAAYPAPRAPDRLHDYVWFCLDHVRTYNRQWSYFPGMDRAEIDEAVRRSLEFGGGTGRATSAPRPPSTIPSISSPEPPAECRHRGAGRPEARKRKRRRPCRFPTT